MATRPNCGREARHVRILYVDPIDDIIEVQCGKCGPSLARIPPPVGSGLGGATRRWLKWR